MSRSCFAPWLAAQDGRTSGARSRVVFDTHHRPCAKMSFRRVHGGNRSCAEDILGDGPEKVSQAHAASRKGLAVHAAPVVLSAKRMTARTISQDSSAAYDLS